MNTEDKMTTEEKLQLMKAINSEVEKVETIISKLSSGPGTYHIEITPGLVEGVLAACILRKKQMIKEAESLMSNQTTAQ